MCIVDAFPLLKAQSKRKFPCVFLVTCFISLVFINIWKKNQCWYLLLILIFIYIYIKVCLQFQIKHLLKFLTSFQHTVVGLSAHSFAQIFSKAMFFWLWAALSWSVPFEEPRFRSMMFLPPLFCSYCNLEIQSYFFFLWTVWCLCLFFLLLLLCLFLFLASWLFHMISWVHSDGPWQTLDWSGLKVGWYWNKS